MKIYLIVAAGMAYMAALFGFVLPLLFSAARTEAVIFGVAVLVLAVPFGGMIVYRLLKKQLPPKDKEL